MDEQLGTRGILKSFVRSHVVEVTMGDHNIFYFEALVLNDLQDPSPGRV